jgi:hypothetical protein
MYCLIMGAIAYLLSGILLALVIDRNDMFGGIYGKIAIRYILFWPLFALDILWDILSFINRK